MTRSFSQNWKILAGAAIAAVLLGSALSVGMFMPKAEASHTIKDDRICTPGVDGTTLGTTWVHHWDKIIFQIVKDPSGTVPAEYLKTPLDIKVEDNPDKAANLVMKVRQFMFDHGIAKLGPVDSTDPDDITFANINAVKIDIIDVEYAIVCTATPPFIG